jgi:hypothetical protein
VRFYEDDIPVRASSPGQVVLERLKVAVARDIDLSGLSDVRLTSHLDRVTNRMRLDLRAAVLAETLPPHHIDTVVRGHRVMPRHATWWDHFKDTYRLRWWMCWRRWRVNYVHVPQWTDFRVRVPVREHWVYPRAAVPLPPEFGGPVLTTMVDEPIGREWQ